jgi:chemotaxis protein methyltransferase CheR
VRQLVRLARLNLVGRWPMRGPFDAIFCRNVMIYFDKPTQARLVARFAELLAPGGYLFVGHSESLTGLAHGFAYVQPAVYRTPA